MICELENHITTFPYREIFAVLVYIGFGFFDFVLVPIVGLCTNRILKDKARRLEHLGLRDHLFINFNRAVTVLFLYHMVQLGCSRHFSQDISSLIASPKSLILNLLGFAFVYLPAVVLVYDFGYTLFHRTLHLEWLYPWIHKHHHAQLSPFRGNTDAINVHPIEYLLGEYNHLWSQFAVSYLAQRFFGGYVPPAVFVVVYIVIAGLLSTLNHTRIDVRIPYLYNVWWHDLHHRVPPTNYGQYTMFWDWVFDWYRPEATKTMFNEKGELAYGSVGTTPPADLSVSDDVVSSPAAAAGGKKSARPTLVSSTSQVVPVDSTPAKNQRSTSGGRRSASTGKRKK